MTRGWHRRPRSRRSHLLELLLGRGSSFGARVAVSEDLVDWYPDLRTWGAWGGALRGCTLTFERGTLLEVSRFGMRGVGRARHVVEVQDLDNRWGGNPFEDELSNSIPNVDLEVVVVVVEEEDINDVTVVGVDDASANIDGKLAGKAATRGYVAVGSWGNGDQ